MSHQQPADVAASKALNWPMAVFLVAGCVLITAGTPYRSADSDEPLAQDVRDVHSVQTASHKPEGEPYPHVERVTLAEAKARFDAGGVVFVDVRAPEEFESGHVPGAVSLPVDEIEGRAHELDPQAAILTYCA